MAGGDAELVVFALGELRLAMPLANVRRVLPAAAVTPLPGAPAFISGVLDVHGELLPVVDLRARLGRPGRPIAPEDQFLLAETRGRALAIAVDRVQGVTRSPIVDLPHDAGLAGAAGETLRGLARLPDGLVLIQDLARFLAPHEEGQLDAALEAAN